ncbi:MAG: hypothetical protein QOG72_1410 [Sphingomonadales bacterium]|jgi:uncharacterized protein YecE (DUF72 family)|nr:hypothetical protein [Sphingomonadales bacterium]
MRQDDIRIGTAGWSIPVRVAEAFPGEGGGLERYSAGFGCAEINSSFHRSHRPDTWRRWAASVPDAFRFSAKLPKEITHKRRLAGCAESLAAALAEMEGLGPKLEILLVQLPPSLAFEAAVAGDFFTALRQGWGRGIACEPRHPSWFEPEPDALLAGLRVARVAADPARVPSAAGPGGWRGLAYYRLHGSPLPYRSSYDDGRLEAYAARIAAQAGPVWCIFDNTASSAATGDALKLKALLGV